MPFQKKLSFIRKIYLKNSTSNFNFQPLPELDKFNQFFVNDYNEKPFTGDPKFVLRDIGA